jgi:putative protease
MNLLRSLPDAFWNLFDDFQIGNIGQIKLLQEMGIERFYGSHPLNAANSLSLAQLYDLGLKGVTLSTELTIAEINDIINKSLLQLELLVYGRIVLMTLEYCPLADEKNSCHNCRFNGIHTLTDRKGYTFPIRKKRIARCYSELLNSQPLFLADKMEPFHRLQVQSWGLKLEGLPAQEYQSVIQCYRYALDYPGSSLPADLAGCAESVKEKGFTRGHFFRGVE